MFGDMTHGLFRGGEQGALLGRGVGVAHVGRPGLGPGHNPGGGRLRTCKIVLCRHFLRLLCETVVGLPS